MPYKSEQALLKVALQTPYFKKLSEGKNCSKLVEPKGLFGIPDVITVQTQTKSKRKLTVFSFEMKLRNWKRALTQAFKYKAFSEFSYVVIDHYHSGSAIKNITEFKKANIGLLSIDKNGRIYCHVKPVKEEPYCDTVRQRLNTMIMPSHVN